MPLRGSLVVQDDFNDGAPASTGRYLLAASSLRDLGGARDIRGLTKVDATSQQNSPLISIAYPEAQGWQGDLLLNEKPFLQVRTAA